MLGVPVVLGSAFYPGQSLSHHPERQAELLNRMFEFCSVGFLQ